MKRILLFALLWLTLLAAPAQDFDAHWIAPPSVDSLAHYYFRQIYLCNGKPRWAQLTLATPGYVKVFVNECNVGTSRFYPMRASGDRRPVRFTLDVTPYLRSDTNVVAVLFSPVYPRKEEMPLSVVFFGEDADGEYFSHFSDSDWLCRKAPSGWLPSGGEWMDGQLYDPFWNSTVVDAVQWEGAEVPASVQPSNKSRHPSESLVNISGVSLSGLSEKAESHAAASPSALWSPYVADCGWHLRSQFGKRYFDVVGDSVEYEFGDGFFGQVRLTLREAQCGEVIHYGPHLYICKGELDEQACPVFALDSYRRILVESNLRSPREIVVDIEGLTVAP